jgi:transporter family protein
VGVVVRTAVALIILGVIAAPQLKQIGTAGAKPLVMMIVGGGVVAGAVGMLCFYAALKGAPLGTVMPIAFTSPLFGAALGILLGGESLTWKTAAGGALTVGGIALLTLK